MRLPFAHLFAPLAPHSNSGEYLRRLPKRGELLAELCSEPSPRTEGLATVDPLPEIASLLLDVLRFGLCLLVLAGHMSEGFFNAGWPNRMVLANGAVPAFFVLSGFVIRYVTSTRERDLRRYFVSRASRIYSVVLPAIVLTILLDAVSLHVNPGFYRSVLLPERWTQLPVRILLNLLFLTQNWGHTILLLSDTPLWSLGYEVPYYILFGIASFTRGPVRILGLIFTGAVAGPQVLFLLPLWCSGLWLYDLWQWFRSGRASPALRSVLLGTSAAVVLFLLLPRQGHTGMDRISALPNPLVLMHAAANRATMFEYGAGLLSFAAVFLLLCATGLFSMPAQTRSARAVRFIAESTFTLYVFHFPMLLFAGALHLYRPDHTGDKLLLLATIILLCIAASIPIDRFKRLLRRWLFSVWKPA